MQFTGTQSASVRKSWNGNATRRKGSGKKTERQRHFEKATDQEEKAKSEKQHRLLKLIQP